MIKQPQTVELIKDSDGITIRGIGIIQSYKLLLDYGDENDEILDTTRGIVKHEKFKAILSGKDWDGVIHLKTYESGFIHPSFKSNDDASEGDGTTLCNLSYINDSCGICLFEVVIKKWNAVWMMLPVSEIPALLPSEYELVFVTNKALKYDYEQYRIVKKKDVYHLIEKEPIE